MEKEIVLSSNTILKNDQPFVERVLRNALEVVDEMIITVFANQLLKQWSFRQEHESYKYKNIVPVRLTEESINWLKNQI